MYTTMDCDFLETEFFYTAQHNGQGESDIDTLSWLKLFPSSQEVVHNTHDESSTSQETDESTSTSATNQDPPILNNICRKNQYKEKLWKNMFYLLEPIEASLQNATLQKEKQSHLGTPWQTLPKVTYPKKHKPLLHPYMTKKFPTLWNKP
uniref:Uncharacterized protein n=2 Tax=Helianthus annuus TaxID=4232 RepID=A0A251T642_HELAN